MLDTGSLLPAALLLQRHSGQPTKNLIEPGMSGSVSVGNIIIADGSDKAADRIARCLHVDPGIGVIRYVSAGYEQTIAARKNLDLRDPMNSYESHFGEYSAIFHYANRQKTASSSAIIGWIAVNPFSFFSRNS